MKYGKEKDKQRQIKIRKITKREKTKTKTKQKTATATTTTTTTATKTTGTKNRTIKRKVIGLIKISIWVFILNAELHRVSLEILLHDFCTFGIFYIFSIKVMSKQLATIVEVIFFKGFWEPTFWPITNVKFITNFSSYFIPSFGRFVFHWLKSIVAGSNLG